MYIRAVGKRYKVECRVTDPSGSVLSWNATFATKAEAQAHGTAKDKEFKAMVAAGFMPCSVRELLDRWRRELAPQRDGGKWDFNRLLAIEQRLDDMGLADLQLSAFKPKQMAAVRRARLGDGISPASVKREEALLRSVWASARHPDWSLTDVDPFRDLGGIKGSQVVPRNRKAQWPELKRILRQLGYRPRSAVKTKSQQVGLAMLLALRTTLRSQEVLQLSDTAVDLKRMVNTVTFATPWPTCADSSPTRWLDASCQCSLPASLPTVRSASRPLIFSVSERSRNNAWRPNAQRPSIRPGCGLTARSSRPCATPFGAAGKLIELAPTEWKGLAHAA